MLSFYPSIWSWEFVLGCCSSSMFHICTLALEWLVYYIVLFIVFLLMLLEFNIFLSFVKADLAFETLPFISSMPWSSLLRNRTMHIGIQICFTLMWIKFHLMPLSFSPTVFLITLVALQHVKSITLRGMQNKIPSLGAGGICVNLSVCLEVWLNTFLDNS